METNLYSAIACNLDNNILSAALPLLEESKIEAIEWSFDALYQVDPVPDWFGELLRTFSKENRLIGHGIFFSLFSRKWSTHQQRWLDQLKHTSQQYPFDHITEHFGFMTGRDFHHGAPLNIPYTSSTLAIGRDRLRRIQEAANCPVGLENLAFSYSLDEVKQQGAFLEKLLEPVNGFLILDLHNVYCQMHNFSVSFDEIINSYPVKKVREIHISGGSWEPSAIEPGRTIRRDTHDDAVPEEVFKLLQKAIPLCNNLKYVVMEQLSNGLETPETRQLFYNDFIRMDEIAKQNHSLTGKPGNSFIPAYTSPLGEPISDRELYEEQTLLSDILETSQSASEAQNRLKESRLANSAWNIENWDPSMLETAVNIAVKWKKQ